jgi:hypothetical protein
MQLIPIYLIIAIELQNFNLAFAPLKTDFCCEIPAGSLFKDLPAVNENTM